MRSLPIQSAPVQRSRLSRAPDSVSLGGVSPSVCVGAGPFQVCVGPFLNDGGVSPSVCIGPVCIGPFAD
jgi:hypothetical protein